MNGLQYFNGITLLFLVALNGVGVAALWSRNEGRAAHILHRPGSGCIECEDQS